ncbi:serine/threonine protein kinase [Ktedonosporobacter rubrisoli]|uniref:non-specific serine/threonine protein kinase n=1 Tax=Ktedonosporobacter rubrisoli TaxID=2509675 RepID=A0A4P6K2G5_KTERU|nr:serine/threonine-protein kinase [Ktedonosporobacter rubrisoli]QBD82205.1 serine/threonine protein kinase [Ktedonosporobacter rubrisoli]
MNELAGLSLGGYLLEEEIGHGSMGVVYRGKQIALGREVAVKVLPQALARDPSYVARFIREAQIIAGLNHPNIVHIYDAGQQNKVLYFVMEYVQGPTLASLLRLDGIIPLHLAVEYAAQIADALDAAYKERNVVHRDIKPENLMLNRWGQIKVMDFGLARATGHQQITVAKTLVGSIYYASPEQVWGQQLDNRSDLYALGVVLYEMVSGQRPFVGRTMPEVTQAIMQGSPQPPGLYNPAVPGELERIILTALARDREQRYAEASLMARDLRLLDLKASAILPSMQASEPRIATPEQPQRLARDRVFIHPPKRPSAQRPNYFNVELDPVPAQARSQPQPVPLPAGALDQKPPVPNRSSPRTPPLPYNEHITPPPLRSIPVKQEAASKALVPFQAGPGPLSIWERIQQLLQRLFAKRR